MIYSLTDRNIQAKQDIGKFKKADRIKIYHKPETQFFPIRKSLTQYGNNSYDD